MVRKPPEYQEGYISMSKSKENNKLLCCIIRSENKHSQDVDKTVQSVKRICGNSEYVVVDYEDDISTIAGKISSRYVSIVLAGSEYNCNGESSVQDALDSDTENIYIANVGEKCGAGYPLRKKYQIEYPMSVNVNDTPAKIWTRLETVFIRTSFFNANVSDKTINGFLDEVMLLTKLVSINNGYALLDSVNIESTNCLEYTKQKKQFLYNPDWYNELFSVIDRMKFDNGNTSYVRAVSAYLIKVSIWENMNGRNKGCLFGDALNNFFNKCHSYLAVIEDTIIANLPGAAYINYYLVTIKNDGICGSIVFHENDIRLMHNGESFINVSKQRLHILMIEQQHDTVIIEAQLCVPKDLINQVTFFAKYNDVAYPGFEGSSYIQYKTFGRIMYLWSPIAFKIPVSEFDSGKISFFCERKGNEVEIEKLFFRGSLSKLDRNCSYWICGNRILLYKNKSIVVKKNKLAVRVTSELRFLAGIIKRRYTDKYKALGTRLMYYFTKTFIKNEILLFEDKVFKAGDNGEYLFDYTRKQNDGIKKYYVLSKDSFEIERFKKEGKRYVVFGSLLHRLLFLNCNLVFATHKDSVKRHGFEGFMNSVFRDKFNHKCVCIQHGLSVQYIPNLVNRIYDNLKGFFLASPIEKKNVENEEYGYVGYESVLKLTGSPRYDGLRNNDKRQVLITPTWRNYLAVKQGMADEARGYSDSFKESAYFRLYNELVNNKKLIDCAKETGYKIIYLLHPATSAQIDDYDVSDGVELLAATGNMSYEKILTESSIMLTDYSGVQFDFAYMYKPIVYFHPDELPPSYDVGYYDYDTMALGEITKTVEETVDLICEYMKNGCVVKTQYKQRIDNFFAYHDHDNCKRVYDEIMRMRENGEI